MAVGCFNLSKWMRRLRNVDRYRLIEGNVVKCEGWFKQDTLVLADITSWWVEYEMTFDQVFLSLREAGQLLWLDYDNDLLAILRSEIPELEAKGS
jgi:hypothetical protein